MSDIFETFWCVVTFSDINMRMKNADGSQNAQYRRKDILSCAKLFEIDVKEILKCTSSII